MHGVDDPLADRQAQAGSAVLARDGGVALGEAVEDRLDHVGRHADAVILDSHSQLAKSPGAGLLDADGDAAVGRELDGVGDEVQQDLPQPGRVAEQVSAVANQCRRKLESLGLGLAVQKRHDGLAQRPRVERLDLEFDVALVVFGDVQDVIDHPEQALACVRNRLDAAPVAVVDGVGLLQKPREADDRRQRRPQFMGHVGQEVGLGPGRGFGFRPLDLQDRLTARKRLLQFPAMDQGGGDRHVQDGAHRQIELQAEHLLDALIVGKS